MDSRCASPSHVSIWVVPDDLAVFADHFPGGALVPAYLQLVHIRHEASKWLQQSPSRIKVTNMKHKRPIIPGQEIQVSFEMVDAGSPVSVALLHDGDVVAHGELVLA